jgi:RimJ/RimL family protein N-acetyltransferase
MPIESLVPEASGLSTERLELVPVSVEHVTFLHALWADPDVRRYLWDDRVIERHDAAAVVDASIASFQRHGFGLWMLELRPALVPIGFCGLRHFGEPAEVEVLYGLSPPYWHLGLATEAALAVLSFAFASGLVQVYAGTDAPNSASQKVIQRLGMSYHSTRVINGIEAVYFAIDKPGFAARIPPGAGGGAPR